MDINIKKLVRLCVGNQSTKCKILIMTNGPWPRIHIDYAEPVNGAYYLVIVDSYTKWPEVC